MVVFVLFADYEVGYTPTNLRIATAKLGMTQAALANALNVAPNTLRNWVMPITAKSRRDMPYTKWVEVVALLNKLDS